MQVYEELVARGLIAQVTDEERIRDLVNHGTLLNEETSDGRKQADRFDWWRYCNDR